MSPGGHVSGAVTSLGQSHFWESHISGAVTSLVTTGGHWGWGQWQVSSTWVRVSRSGLQNTVLEEEKCWPPSHGR